MAIIRQRFGGQSEDEQLSSLVQGKLGCPSGRAVLSGPQLQDPGIGIDCGRIAAGAVPLPEEDLGK
jgi:hypothetical protein